MAEVIPMLKRDYGIKRKPITTRNPQANAMVESCHQTLRSMIATKSIKSKADLPKDNPWIGVLTASESTTCRIRAYVHTYSAHKQDSNRTHAGYSAHAHDTILRGRAYSLGHNRGACVRKILEVFFCFKQRVRNVFDHHTKY